MTVIRVGPEAPVFTFQNADLIGGTHFSGSGSFLGASCFNTDTQTWYTILPDGTLGGYSLFSTIISAGENNIGLLGGHTSTISTEITTTATQAAYIANDAVLVSGGGASAIANAGRTTGGTGYIAGIMLITDMKSITPRFRIHFYNALPTLVADNAPWASLYADVGKQIGYWDMPAMNTPIDITNSTLSRTLDFSMRIPYACVTTSLYFALETLDGFTPTNSQKFTLKVALEQN